MPDQKKKQKDRQQTMKMLTLVTQFGFSMLAPILLCFFAGLWLDKLFRTNFIMIVLFFVGAIAGFRNVYVLATGSMSKHKFHRNRDEDVLPEAFANEEEKEDPS